MKIKYKKQKINLLTGFLITMIFHKETQNLLRRYDLNCMHSDLKK